MTTDGRIAVLTNFHEDRPGPPAAVSRGAMVNAFLAPAPADAEAVDTEGFVRGLISGEGARGAGGFSLVCGRMGAPLAVVSNRMRATQDVAWIGAGVPAVGLSNATFGDRSWQKVVRGEKALEEVLRRAVLEGWGAQDLIRELFGVLSIDATQRFADGLSWDQMAETARERIFLSLQGNGGSSLDGATKRSSLAADSGLYGTQKQTLVLLNRSMHVTYVEKTLYDKEGNDVSKDETFTSRVEYTIAR